MQRHTKNLTKLSQKPVGGLSLLLVTAVYKLMIVFHFICLFLADWSDYNKLKIDFMHILIICYT